MAHMRPLDCGAISSNGIYSRVYDTSTAHCKSASEKHERYLISLEKQKRFLKQVNVKDKEQEELQKREQAFSPYVNGANSVLPRKSSTPRKKPQAGTLRTISRSLHPIGTNPNEGSGLRQPVVTPRPKSVAGCPRKSTAFLNRSRKFWGQGSVQIKKSDGDTIRAAMNEDDYMYSDDFEEYASSDSIDESLEFDTDSTSMEGQVCHKVSTRKCWKDSPHITSSQVVVEDIATDSDGLDISYSDIPILGQTTYKIKFS